MKKTSAKWSRFFSSFLFSALISIGTVFCPITAFQIPVQREELILFCIAVSLAAALVFQAKRAWILICALTVPLAAALYYFWDRLFQAFSVALNLVTTQYAIPFDSISAVTLVPDLPAGAEATYYFFLAATVLAFVTAWVISDRLSIWIVAAVSLPHLIICLIILETVPAWWALLILSAAYALMILTQGLRRHSGAAGDRLTVQVLIPSLLLAVLLAVLVSPADYQRSDWISKAQTTFSRTVNHLSFLRYNEKNGHVEFVSPFTPSTLGSRVWDSSVSRVNLDKVGPQSKTGLQVMQVYSDMAATFHLRADSLATYESNAWTALDSSLYKSASISQGVLMSGSTSGSSVMKFKTDMKASIYYTPYKPTALPENAESVGDAYILNPDQQVEYDVPFVSGAPSADTGSDYETFVYANYLQVPDETRSQLADITALFPSQSYASVGAQAAAVANYVETSASYDLNTPHVPGGEDFTVWFLKESDTGYCVHYATATAVLLRCLGIPSRYVTGYLIQTKAGQWTNVTEDDAHAWVEYYVKGQGWQVVDPTPPEPEQTESGSTGSQSSSKPEETTTPETVSKPDVSTSTPEVTPPTPGVSSSSSGNTASQQSSRKGISAAGKRVIIIVFVLIILYFWHVFVKRLRNIFLHRGSLNRQVISYFRHIQWLNKLAGKPDPIEFHDMALKARFSQHKMTAEELTRLREYADATTKELLSQPKKSRRFLYRMVYGL
jgi:transglutaminase-like putative cysteine protease